MWLSPDNSLYQALRLLSVCIPDYGNPVVYYSHNRLIDASLGSCLVRRPPLYPVEARATAHCDTNAACCATRGGRRMGAPGREGGPCLACESASTRDLCLRRVLDRNDSYRLSASIRTRIYIFITLLNIASQVLSRKALYPKAPLSTITLEQVQGL